MSGITENGTRYPDGASKAKNLGAELRTMALDLEAFTVGSGTSWVKPLLTAAASLDSLPNGVRGVTPAAATAMGLPGGVGGELEIIVWSEFAGIAIWRPLFKPTQEWIARKTAGWDTWEPSNGPAEHARVLQQNDAAIDTWGASKSGWYNVPSALRVGYVTAAGSTPPNGGQPFKLLHAAQTDDIRFQLALSYPAAGQSGSMVFVRFMAFTSSTYSDWMQLGSGSADAGSAEHLVRERAMLLRSSKKVATPGGVVLVFDHGLTKFKSTVWPLLQARGIPVTLALNPGTMADANNSGATWADLRAWIATGLVEPANHSYDHATIAPGNPVALERAIRGSREELEAQLAVPIDTWVQPGNDLADFAVSNTDPNVYATTDAGRIILASHGAVSGVQPPGVAVRPLGQPLIGLNGTWIDTGNTAGAQAAIQAAIDGGGYQIIRFHPQFLNDAGYLTTAQLTAFLDWIKGKMTAGELTALTFREALTARHERFDPVVGKDTGKRDVTPLISGGWTLFQAILRRQGSTVSLYIRNMNGASATSNTFLNLPAGFRDNSVNSAAQPAAGLHLSKTDSAPVNLISTYSGALSTISRGVDLQMLRTWTTDDPWPATLPGTPA